MVGNGRSTDVTKLSFSMENGLNALILCPLLQLFRYLLVMVYLYLLLPLNESYTDDTDILLYIYASKQLAPTTVFYHKEDPVSKDHMFVANISTVSN